jgi:ribonuclease P protein component
VRNRFPKSARLLERSEFQQTLDQGVRVASPEWVVAARVRPGATGARLGLVVSRKVGNAVIRNRVKRRMREYFRLTMGTRSPIDIVVIARSAAADRTYEQLASAFESCLRRLEKKLGQIPSGGDRSCESQPNN